MRVITATIVLFFATPSVWGDLIVDVLDGEIAVGGTGFVDVLVRSDGTDLLAITGFEFDITDIGSPVGDLRFSDPQTTTDPTLSNYVFFGNSGAFSSLVSNSPASTTMTGAGLTADGQNETITTTNRLLVRLDLEHFLPGGTDPTTAFGDQFSIALDTNALATRFVDKDGGLATFTASSGTITATPEPSSLLCCGLAGAAFLLWHRRKASLAVS